MILLEEILMTEREMKIPGPDHPITIEPCEGRVIVTVSSCVIADTAGALTLTEAGYPAVQYIPRADVDMALLERSSLTTYCPYKGDASYFSIPSGGDRAINAAWSYEAPFAAVEKIEGYLAFDPDRVGSIIVETI
jgi:uncharacterized protein (DUF427 family)